MTNITYLAIGELTHLKSMMEADSVVIRGRLDPNESAGIFNGYEAVSIIANGKEYTHLIKPQIEQNA